MPCPLRNCTLQMIFDAVPSKFVAIFIVGISVFSLLAALTAQFGFGLRPCDLCLYQRVPFALNIAIGLAALFSDRLRKPLIGIAGSAFLVNSFIAAFHSGVERKWWVGLTGCTTPDMSGSVEELLKRIQETDVVRCDEIPWSFLGLSMANYNVFFCFGLGILCLCFVMMNKAERPTQSEPST